LLRSGLMSLYWSRHGFHVATLCFRIWRCSGFAIAHVSLHVDLTSDKAHWVDFVSLDLARLTASPPHKAAGQVCHAAGRVCCRGFVAGRRRPPHARPTWWHRVTRCNNRGLPDRGQSHLLVQPVRTEVLIEDRICPSFSPYQERGKRASEARRIIMRLRED
jgi:hypothetical protein